MFFYTVYNQFAIIFKKFPQKKCKNNFIIHYGFIPFSQKKKFQKQMFLQKVYD